ncbi:septation ring formation regulator EzrA [Bacillus carboniphilus]|uniref:Septation ring formation regulator EzrA n=1 Tax=Bacillus carboniphilus TaxID=86663 RepID=A0ABY9K046_9BACI|nr:septation ring formation regulator EzrA [Bacillus carboniphilus]WLR44192.1 septation ring formation regulator EzrA [Bacillus carboniphilus]
MEYIIGIIVVLVLLFSYSYYLRRNIYKQVDRLEGKKIEIMNQSVADELAKVKQLKMAGQTEELFERCRKDWDDIITSQMPKVEEMLYDVEGYADKYRIKRAKQVLQHIEDYLNVVNENIDSIKEEIMNLIMSEEKNATDIQEVKKQFKEIKKQLLAHSYTYGDVFEKLETSLYESFDQLKNFEIETEQGNYFAAKKVLAEQKRKLEKLQNQANNIPRFLIECNTNIPSELEELKKGYQEMIEKGYHLSHIDIDDEIGKVKALLEETLKMVHDGEVSGVEENITGMKDLIDGLYDIFEQEVEAKQYVHQESTSIIYTIQKLSADQKEIAEETSLIKHSYQLKEEDSKKLTEIDEALERIKNQYEQILTKMQMPNIPHSLS